MKTEVWAPGVWPIAPPDKWLSRLITEAVNAIGAGPSPEPVNASSNCYFVQCVFKRKTE